MEHDPHSLNPVSPEKFISWLDIVKGVGEVALEFITKRFTSEAPDYMSTHYIHPLDHDIDNRLYEEDERGAA